MAKRKPHELHYREKHRFADAKLHQPILDGGDHAAAEKISDQVARDIGLTDAEIAALSSKQGKAKAMPMTPHKGESQPDFMSRCVPDLMGDGKRENDQAVAACLTIWREADKKQFADPGYLSDRKKRFAIDTAADVRVAWYAAHKQASNYTPAQLTRITMRIATAWKVLLGAAPPAADDASLRREVIGIVKQYAPDPDAGESHDDYMDRCTDELSDDMDDDDAEEACQLSWDENGNGDEGDRAGPVFHKTHA
jgi:hypothetical protein